jgi:hypothetical protein
MKPYQIRPISSRFGYDDFDTAVAGLRNHHSETVEFSLDFSALPLEPSELRRDIRVVPVAYQLFGVDWYPDAFVMADCQVVRQVVSPLEGTVGLTIKAPTFIEERKVETWRRIGYRFLKPIAKWLKRI